MSSQSELVHVFFHKQSYTFCYLIVDTKTQVGAIIDPVLDFDYYSGRSSTEFCDNLIKHVKENNIYNQMVKRTKMQNTYYIEASLICLIVRTSHVCVLLLGQGNP